MQEITKIEKKLPNQEIDYFKIGRILLSRWYWILGMVILCIVVAKIYLWYTPKMYSTNATLKFEDRRSELTDLNGNNMLPDRASYRIQSEIFVIQSSQLLLRAIKDLDYKISFYIAGRVRTTETYPQKPLDISFITLDSLNFYRDMITFKPVDRSTYSLTYNMGGKVAENNHTYNSPVTVGPTTFTIKYPGEISKNTVYLFKFNRPEDLLGRVRGGLYTGEVVKYSNIITLQQNDANPEFAADVLNKILDEYLLYDKEQKAKSASQMISFIDKQIDFLSKEVENSETSLQQYKQQKKIVDVGSASDAVLTKSKDLESQRSIYKLQLLAINQLQNKIIEEKDNVSLNFNMSGSVDPLLSSLIISFNTLINEKSNLLKTYNAQSGPVKEINAQILQVKKAALANINSSVESVQKNIAYIDNQLKSVNQQISLLPVAQRDMVSLERRFDINEKVYSFLSEKKLDAQINRSAILPGASIVERAQPNFSPISPDEHTINRLAITIGLLAGLGIIISIRLLNPYIYDKETVESLTTIPIIGIIRKFPSNLDESNSQLLALSKPRSIFAESVRAVRTNLNFLASEKQSKIICITSEVAGEGKSFVSVNLASTLALINKKVILIGADLRRSKVHRTFNVPNDLGLSNYLANQIEADGIINHSEVECLDFIISGPVPPNPSELLHSARMSELIEHLKKTYDIIIVDTAPIGLVSDSIPLIRMSDINVFVIRSGKSKYYAATVPERIANEYHLNNTVIILNAFEEDLLHSRYYTTKFTGEGYGTRYYYYSDYSGYANSGYYIDDEKSTWQKIKSWLKL